MPDINFATSADESFEFDFKDISCIADAVIIYDCKDVLYLYSLISYIRYLHCTICELHLVCYNFNLVTARNRYSYILLQ